MKKTILFLGFLGFCNFNAQSVGNSPYAIYGIGDVKFDNDLETSAMGGISTAFVNDFSNKFNFANPATNTNFALTAFSIEATNENNFFNSNYQGIKTKKHTTFLSNVSVAFPVSKKVKFGFGFQPYSSKSYQFYGVKSVGDKLQENYFKGDGGISSVQGAIAYQFNKELSFGLRSNLYFGKIIDTEEVYFSDSNLINGFENSNVVQAFSLTFATAYQKKLKDDKKLTLGATFSTGAMGKINSHYQNSTYFYERNDRTKEKQNISVIEQRNQSGKSIVPSQFSLGVGYGTEAKWFVSTQLDYKNGYTVEVMKPFVYQNSYKLSAGGWYLPNYNNFRNYFSRVIYRFGAYYEKGGLAVNPLNSATKTSVNEFALSAGATFPFGGTNINRINSMDIAVELGKRGTIENQLIRQNFINLKIGLNFSDLWFRKVEFD